VIFTSACAGRLWTTIPMFASTRGRMLIEDMVVGVIRRQHDSHTFCRRMVR
jgi:hypothetical protein